MVGLDGVEYLIAFDEAEGEGGGDKVEAGLDPEGDVFGADVGERGSHGGDFDESLDGGGGGEDERESVPEAGHVALRPDHACGEEEDEAEEGEAEEGRDLVADEDVAHGDAEEDDGEDEGEEEEEYGVEVAELWHVEHSGDEPECDEADGGVDDEVAECASDGDAVGAAGAETCGDDEEGAFVLTGVAAEEADAEEEGLVDDENDECGEEEGAVAVGGVEGGDFLIDDGLHLLLCGETGEAVGGIALELDGVHFVDEDGVGAEECGFVVVEGAHVGEDGHMGSAFGGEVGGEVFGEEEDGVDVAVFHQSFGLGHRGAFVFDGDFGSGLHFVDEAAAFVAEGLVDDSDGEVGDVLLLVHEAEDDGVE